MDLFISWSGARSHQAALAIQDWLGLVIQQVKPFISSDIKKGERWNSTIAGKLDKISEGIIVVTDDNIESPWLNFEAGALAKSEKNASVRTVLLGIEPSQVSGPLTSFQHTLLGNREDVWKLVKSINGSCDTPVDETRLQRTFDLTYPEFEAKISEIAYQQEVLPGAEEATPRRSVEDMLAEVLERVRFADREIPDQRLLMALEENYENQRTMRRGFEEFAREQSAQRAVLMDISSLFDRLFGEAPKIEQFARLNSDGFPPTVEHPKYGWGEVVDPRATDQGRIKVLFEDGQKREVSLHDVSVMPRPRSETASARRERIRRATE